jgi:hypothetical protein
VDVRADRRTGRVVGSLFILASVAGVLGLALQQPVEDPNYLTKMSLEEVRVATGAFAELVMAVAVAGIAIAIYPTLKRHGERLALGYVAARAIEAVVYVVDTILLLTLLTVSREFVSGGADVAELRALGGVLSAGRDWAGNAVLDVAVFSLSALILNYALLRARLVPRWLSVWGLMGAASCLAAGVMVLYGLEAASTTQVLLDVPLGLQEMALALWLIVKGFDASASASEPEREPVAIGV